MIFTVILILCGGSSLVAAGSAALCAVSPSVRRQFIGDIKPR